MTRYDLVHAIDACWGTARSGHHRAAASGGTGLLRLSRFERHPPPTRSAISAGMPGPGRTPNFFRVVHLLNSLRRLSASVIGPPHSEWT